MEVDSVSAHQCVARFVETNLSLDKPATFPSEFQLGHIEIQGCAIQAQRGLFRCLLQNSAFAMEKFA